MPTMAWAAGVPEIVGALGVPTLTPDEPTPGAPVLSVEPEPEPTPTWPQPARVAVANKTRSSTARPQRALETLIDTPCFSRSPFARLRTPGDSDRRQRCG
jgi:hypothetical protein